MSEWETQQGKETFKRWYCPGCKVELKFKERLKLPELLKCISCGSEWCMIAGPHSGQRSDSIRKEQSEKVRDA